MVQFSITEYGKSCGVPDTYVRTISTFLSVGDMRSAKDQIDESYRQYGGWRPIGGITLQKDRETIRFDDEGDTCRPIAEATLRDQKLFLYRSDWLAIVNTDGTYEIARID